MPLPLPGMNPYLESLEPWSEFHSRMIVAIADALTLIELIELRVKTMGSTTMNYPGRKKGTEPDDAYH